MKFSGDWGRKAIHALEGVGLVFFWVNDGLTTYDVFFWVNDCFLGLMMFFWV